MTKAYISIYKDKTKKRVENNSMLVSIEVTILNIYVIQISNSAIKSNRIKSVYSCRILILFLTISSYFKVYTTIVRNVNSKTTYQRHADNSYTYLAVAKGYVLQVKRLSKQTN